MQVCRYGTAMGAVPTLAAERLRCRGRRWSSRPSVCARRPSDQQQLREGGVVQTVDAFTAGKARGVLAQDAVFLSRFSRGWLVTVKGGL